MSKSPPTLALSVLSALLPGMPVALAQYQCASYYFLSPVAAQPNPACGKYVALAGGSCAFAGDFPLFLAGQGNTSTVVMTNRATRDVTFRLGFNCPAGSNGPNNGNCPVYISSFGGPPGVGDGIDGTIVPGSPFVFSLVYPGQNIDSLNPPPEPNQLGVGTISMIAGRRSAAPPDERRRARDVQGLGSGGAQFLDERNCHTQRQTLVAGAWGR